MLKKFGISKIDQLPTICIPKAGNCDLFGDEVVVFLPMGKGFLKIGLSMEVPESTYGRHALQSRLAHKHSLDIGASIKDRYYWGKVKVVLFTLRKNTPLINPIQLIWAKIQVPELEEVEYLE
ncbi:uncharacterized protein [Ambystoma mexicanum]|uniref:uncharacterized protein n=1 Tax=Ambystoma mexicanum TaxID=8296 RepID=UPI0037E768F5